MINVSYDVFAETFLSKVTEYNFIHLEEEDKTRIVDGYMKRAWAQFVSTCRFKNKYSIVSIEAPEEAPEDDSEDEGESVIIPENDDTDSNDAGIGTYSEDENEDITDGDDTTENEEPTEAEDENTNDDDNSGSDEPDTSDTSAEEYQRTEEFALDIKEDELDEIVDIVSEGMLVQWMKPYMYKQENLENLLNTIDYSAYSPAELLYRVTSAYNMCKKDFIRMMREYTFNHGDLTDLYL